MRYLVACCLICIRQVFSRDKTDVIQNVIPGETDVEQNSTMAEVPFQCILAQGIKALVHLITDMMISLIVVAVVFAALPLILK